MRNCPTYPDTSTGGSGGKRKDKRPKNDETAPEEGKPKKEVTRYKAVTNHILENDRQVIEYEECDGDDEDSDYGGHGRFKSFSYAQVAIGEAKRKTVELYTEDELNEMGVCCF